jgi:hypothetical protein
MIAVADKDYRGAIARFRQALVIEPAATRIRLELARACYLARDYDNAMREFQLARAGNPPAGVVVSIDRFVATIRREKRWSYSVDLAVAPDTNINHATSARDAIIFGLPFDLDPNARGRSGVGLAAGGAVEFQPRLADTVRLRLGLVAERRQYLNTQFDDMTVEAQAGPRFVLPRWDISLLATEYRRWFGDRPYNDGLGGRIELTRFLSARTAVFMSASAEDLRYPHAPLYSGPAWSVTAGLSHALTPASSLSVRGGVSRQSARTPDLANRGWFGGFDYQRDLKGGFSIEIAPEIVRWRYDAIDPFFWVRRSDTQEDVQLAVLNRRVTWKGFTPRLAYTFVHRKSSISLYSFDQNRLEVGLTRVF